ncbi:CbtA family protein [Rhizobium sp. S-51]|uniref:CbtA family protein n=1 Tax=Rhizobium terricola TaxID=2728849 RepID=A0A7Y0B0H2_9HYPH|nr:CbtA family protein [Rhizobium terricola]NML76901.1 CbtA family protein [Rhizobium terricola]
MSLFRSLVFTSVLVGLIVGTVVTLAQFLGTTPLILAAEVFEGGDVAESHGAGQGTVAAHDHGDAAATEAHDHHSADAWAPADGIERNAYTLVANILTATGFALALNGLMQISGRQSDWRHGLIWGLCGFVVVMLAPGFGLHPELPGTPAAPLLDRQVWWVGTALSTAAGLALLFFQRKPWAAAAAIVLIALPHVIGAPLPPDGEHALAPEAMSHRFVVVATLTSLLFWALLGALSGHFRRRFEA